MASRMKDEWYIREAKEQFHEEGRIEIDDGVFVTEVSRNEEADSDHGAYVQAWVWVDDPRPNDNAPKCPWCGAESTFEPRESGLKTREDFSLNGYVCEGQESHTFWVLA